MKIKTVALALALLTLLANSTAAIAQGVTDSAREWSAVKALSPGDKLSVRLKDGKQVEGNLLGVSDATLTLERGNNTADLNRDSISRVYRLVRRSAGKSIGKSAAIGAAIGFGVGAGAGIGIGNYEDIERGELVAILGGVGAAIGAGIGAIIGAAGSKQRRVLVYEAK